MTLGLFRKMLSGFPDDCDLMVVIKTGDKQCIVEDLIDFSPSNVDCDSPETCKGLYLYGDSFSDEF